MQQDNSQGLQSGSCRIFRCWVCHANLLLIKLVLGWLYESSIYFYSKSMENKRDNKQ